MTKKRALVTGGSGAIGAVIAQRLAVDGHDVIIHAHRHVASAEQMAEKIRVHGGSARSVSFDITDGVATRNTLEGLLKDGLADMRLGDRVTLARLATPPLLPALLADAERQVVEAALINPRLREEDVTTALRRDDARVTLVEAAAASTRWATSYAVKLAIVLSPRTPLPLALERITSLVPRDLRRLALDASLRPLIQAAARKVIEQEAEPS